MHSSLTPWKNCRLAIFGTVVSIGLFIASIVTPFYSYTYFYQGTTMTFLDIIQANSTILIPFISIIIALIFLVASLVLMMIFPSNKIMQNVSSGLTFVSAIISLAIFIISVSRLWITPYQFSYSAAQELLVGYILYIIFLVYNGILSCYTMAINGK